MGQCKSRNKAEIRPYSLFDIPLNGTVTLCTLLKVRRLYDIRSDCEKSQIRADNKLAEAEDEEAKEVKEEEEEKSLLILPLFHPISSPQR